MDKTNNYFEKYAITVIDEYGKIIAEERKGNAKNHFEVFSKLQEQDPYLLEGYQKSLEASGGFELSHYCAANDKVVIWPSEINSSKIILVTLPEMATNEQCSSLKKLLPFLSEKEVYITTARFKKKRSPKVIYRSIPTSGSSSKAQNALNEYMDKCIAINNFGFEFNGDIRNTIESNEPSKPKK